MSPQSLATLTTLRQIHTATVKLSNEWTRFTLTSPFSHSLISDDWGCLDQSSSLVVMRQPHTPIVVLSPTPSRTCDPHTPRRHPRPPARSMTTAFRLPYFHKLSNSGFFSFRVPNLSWFRCWRWSWFPLHAALSFRQVMGKEGECRQQRPSRC